MDFIKAGLTLKGEDLMILRTFIEHLPPKYFFTFLLNIVTSVSLKIFSFHCFVLALIYFNQNPLSTIQLDNWFCI